MKYLIAILLLSNLAFAITAPEEVSSENVEVGAPKDCVTLGKSDDQGDDVDQLALQKKVMDCLGPQEDSSPEEIQKKSNSREVVSQ